MKLDVALAGIDQRKAHMLARDAAEKLRWKKPVCVHVPILMGLQGPVAEEKQYDENKAINLAISSKMSKSKPESCIFVHDQPEDIKRKIRNAFCPPKQANGNPILELAKHAVFPRMEELIVPRPKKYGGVVAYKSYVELENDYVKGKIHPLDLKNGVAEALIKILEPVREYFKRNPNNLNRMLEIEITR
jgi:tyrosyl-tRNA synthetase